MFSNFEDYLPNMSNISNDLIEIDNYTIKLHEKLNSEEIYFL
jgi:hypothetical protein